MLEHARDVLSKNFVEVVRNGIAYRHTIPSSQFYVHQWNWDSCTHAMGLVHLDPQRAYDELDSLVSGQWESGHIGAITFNPKETSYYSRVENWATDSFARGDTHSTGITQPPLLAIAVDYVRRNAPAGAELDAFLTRMLPSVVAFHENLQRHRDPEQSGLLTVVHPWETGCDNSPRWDAALEDMPLGDVPQSVIDDVNEHRQDLNVGQASHRPSQEDYYRYMHLVHVGNELHWDMDRVVAESPFAMKDILFNALWVRANECLASMLKDVNTGDPERYEQWADKSRTALANTWDAEARQYCDINVTRRSWTPVATHTIATFTPLLAGAVTDEQLPVLLEELHNPTRYWTEFPIPTTALDNPAFDAQKYWRGPTWPITNLLVLEGLKRYADKSTLAGEMATTVVDRTIQLIETRGFYEYFDATEGRARPGQDDPFALGFGEFSWTAAIYIYLNARFR